MTKFAQSPHSNLYAPVTTTGARIPTHEGGIGYERDAKSELFLLAVTNMVREDTFYETGTKRDERFVKLIHQVTTEDPDWIGRFIPYLRDTMQMRSASVVMAAEYVKAGGPYGRKVISSALSRADEPAEMLAYWAQTYGRKFSQPVKRGVADAVSRLYNERSALRYDGQGKAWRMGDVLDLTHPKPKAPWQSALFRYLLDVRHGRAGNLEALPLLTAVKVWEDGNGEGPLPEGVSWERLSTYRKMVAADWESVIPQMGYMALLRNLRNFDQAGISAEAAASVAARLADPEQVAKSRQFPLRFFSAMKAVQSMTYLPALEAAVNGTLANVPVLPGRTLIMVDDSGSMDDRLSAKSTLMRREAASLFGAALALRAEDATLVAYATQGFLITVPKGGSVLRLAGQTAQATNGGTNTFPILQAAYAGHDRVVILTDEQAFYSGYDATDIKVPIYTFNLAGYHAGHMESGQHHRYTFGGLTDAGFTMLAALDSRREGEWPF